MRTLIGIVALAGVVALAGTVSAGEVCGASFAQNCAKCHGDDGKGGKVCKKDVTAKLGECDDSAVAAIRAVKMHSSIKDVSDDDIKAAVKFMKCSGATKSVFADNCAKCHGNNAKGGKVVKKDVTAIVDGKSADDVLAMVRAVKMHAGIKDLSDGDVKAGIAYFQAGATFGKKCATCHGDDAKGGKVCKKNITEGLGGKSCADTCKAIREGKTHSAAKGMSDEELGALVEYLNGLSKGN